MITDLLESPPTVDPFAALATFRTVAITSAIAAARSGLTAREIFRPASVTNDRVDITPDDPSMRYQLGVKSVVRMTLTEIPGVRSAGKIVGDVFELRGHGSSWAQALAMATRNPSEVAKP